MSTIMVADDEADTRFLVRELLERAGHVVLEAFDGIDCLEKLKSLTPDLLLLDVMMPGMDGWEILERIQEDNGLSGVKVALFTVKPLVPEVLDNKSLDGLVNYINKPFSNEGLIESVDHTLMDMARVVEGVGSFNDQAKAGALEFEELSNELLLHENFLRLFRTLLDKRKKDGSLDDILSFEDVIKSEERLIRSYKRRIEGISPPLM